MKISKFFIASILLFAGCSNSKEIVVRCAQLDPLEKVFTEVSYFVENPDTATVAKGETASFQFVISSVFPIRDLKIEAGDLACNDQQIAATLKAFVGYIRVGHHAQSPSKDAIFPISEYYPDCLQEVESVDVPPMMNQPLWVSYNIPRDVQSGIYSATLIFSGTADGKPFKISKKVNAKVFPVTLPEQTLWVTNWYATHGLRKMNDNKPVEPYSDRYWELLTEMAHVMRDHGQNTYLIWLNDLGIAQLTGDHFSFDFTNFDKLVDLFIREGGLKRIEGSHLADRHGGQSNWFGDFVVNVPSVGSLPIEDEMTQNYLSQFLPVLYSHLEKKGWAGMYMQHIADEPIDANADSYIRIADFVKKLMPGVPIIDALMSHKLANTVDIWVPILNQYHKDHAFFQERQAAGDETWFYTSGDPQDNYTNRFLESPLLYPRFMHWINYCYKATGYLHWGLNHWHLNWTNDAAATDHPTWPGGEQWIVYPAYGKVYSSIRLAAMRDGIADYELLKLLEQKSPEKAKELAGKVIQDFDKYNSNVRAFRLTRQMLLERLSELK